jgi:hypothetical protein
MASVKAIAAVCEAICHILRSAAAEDAAELGDIEPEFRVFDASDFTEANEPLGTGVSVFVYRVMPSLTHRTPPGRVMPDGRRRRSSLPVDIHLLLTAWAETASTEHLLTAWMMRSLEDYPTLPSSLLNFEYPDVFESGEAVELVISEMPSDELLQWWDLVNGETTTFHLTIPYLVRAVTIESKRETPAGEPVQVRGFQAAVFDGSAEDGS